MIEAKPDATSLGGDSLQAIGRRCKSQFVIRCVLITDRKLVLIVLDVGFEVGLVRVKKFPSRTIVVVAQPGAGYVRPG